MAEPERKQAKGKGDGPPRGGLLRQLLGVLRLLFLMLLATLLVLAGEWLTDPSVTPLRVARIEGDLHHLKRSELEKAIAEATQAGFFTVDVQAVKRAAEALPWVAKSSVRRVWPDTLHLWVVEQTPLARWGDHALVNPDGQVFQPSADTIPEGLPWLYGPEGSGREVVEQYRRCRNLLQGIGMELTRLRLSDRRAWELETNPRMTVQLGVEELDARLRQMVRLYPLLRDSRPDLIRRMDMRYDKGMAVEWEPAPPVDGSAS